MLILITRNLVCNNTILPSDRLLLPLLLLVRWNSRSLTVSNYAYKPPHKQHQHSVLPCNFLTDDSQTVAPFEFSGTIPAGGQDRAQNLLFAPSYAVVCGIDLLFHIGLNDTVKG